MRLFMAVTNDRYELPVAIEETQTELAKKIGMSGSLVSKYLKKQLVPGKKAKYRFYEMKGE